MPTSERVRLGTLDTWVLRPDGWTPADGVCVLLHGFGAPGDDLVALAEYVDAPARMAWAFPAALLELPGIYGEARAWWMIDLARFERAAAQGTLGDLIRDEPEGLAAARAAVLGMLDAVRTDLGVADDRVVLGGFSQGAMLSLDVILRSDRAFAAAILMSGSHLAADAWAPRLAGRAGLRVLISHGRQDPLLPFPISEGLVDRLVSAGLDVTWLPFDGAHSIPPQVLAAAGRLLGAALDR
ncbi:MAG: hypothetical protein R2939_05675 [Kofleriaceae bacterium]